MRRTWLAKILVLLAACMSAAWWLQRGNGVDRSPQAPATQGGDARAQQTGAATASGDPATALDAAVDPMAAGREDDAGTGAVSEDPTPVAPTVPRSPHAANAHGPEPLSQEDQARMDAMLGRLRRANSTIGEYEVLVESEPPDPEWSGRMEAMLRQALVRHGGAFTGLGISAPHCTRSLCRLTAVARAATTERPDADWQRLVYRIAGDPWWQQEFFDVSTTVTNDGQGVLYVTYYLRK